MEGCIEVRNGIQTSFVTTPDEVINNMSSSRSEEIRFFYATPLSYLLYHVLFDACFDYPSCLSNLNWTMLAICNFIKILSIVPSPIYLWNYLTVQNIFWDNGSLICLESKVIECYIKIFVTTTSSVYEFVLCLLSLKGKSKFCMACCFRNQSGNQLDFNRKLILC